MSRIYKPQPVTKLHFVNTPITFNIPLTFHQPQPSTITPVVPIESNFPHFKNNQIKVQITVEKKAFIETKPAKQVHRSSMAENQRKSGAKLTRTSVGTNLRKGSPKFTTTSVGKNHRKRSAKCTRTIVTTNWRKRGSFFRK